LGWGEERGRVVSEDADRSGIAETQASARAPMDVTEPGTRWSVAIVPRSLLCWQSSGAGGVLVQISRSVHTMSQSVATRIVADDHRTVHRWSTARTRSAGGARSSTRARAPPGGDLETVSARQMGPAERNRMSRERPGGTS